MANTERLKVIQLVREAKKSVGSARFDQSISSSRQILEKLYIRLDDIEDDLIRGEIADKVSLLTKASEDLEVINKKIKEDIKELEGIAELVGKVANGVKILVNLAETGAELLT